MRKAQSAPINVTALQGVVMVYKPNDEIYYNDDGSRREITAAEWRNMAQHIIDASWWDVVGWAEEVVSSYGVP